MKKVKLIWKAGLLTALVLASFAYPGQAFAAMKNVMCIKTNTGNYFPVVRVSMMVVPDGGSTFDILLKDGEGESNVKSISFEKHDEDVDFSKYNTGGGGSNIDMTKPVYLITNTGKYFSMKSLPQMVAKEGSEKFDVVVGGETEYDVSAVYFYRGDDVESAKNTVDVKAPVMEQLKLMTPIKSQLQISGCGDAKTAAVYDLSGKRMGEAAVSNGVTTIQVGNFPAGVYVVKVGNKALKFTKK